jgi:hypothetical protein
MSRYAPTDPALLLCALVDFVADALVARLRAGRLAPTSGAELPERYARGSTR